jgi:pimeloyl-ACP methyl ester carboxylesterase
MRTYVLIPGAGGAGWYWSRVAPMLEQAGHRPVVVDLPAADESAGLPDYAERVVAAATGRGDTDSTVVVAQSLGGFTAPLVCARMPVRELVFVNAMIPQPGERAADWGEATGSDAARLAAADQAGYSHDFDLETYFLHDVDPAVAAEGEPYQQPEANVAFESVCDFERWPDIPIRVLAGADDRLFPAEFQRRVARERLGIDADVLPGGHLIALSNAPAVTEYLLRGSA